MKTSFHCSIETGSDMSRFILKMMLKIEKYEDEKVMNTTIILIEIIDLPIYKYIFHDIQRTGRGKRWKTIRSNISEKIQEITSVVPTFSPFPHPHPQE